MTTALLGMEATMQYILRCAMALMLLFLSPALAQTTDDSAIAKLLHTTFDRPEAPLTIAPVVVSGNHAIAGWIQEDMGGRALLRRKGQSWELILCAGDGIKSQDALTKAGIPVRDAAALERDLAAAERKLSSQHVAMFSRFEGMLMTGAATIRLSITASAKNDYNSRVTDNILRVGVNYKFDPNEVWGSNERSETTSVVGSCKSSGDKG